MEEEAFKSTAEPRKSVELIKCCRNEESQNFMEASKNDLQGEILEIYSNRSFLVDDMELTQRKSQVINGKASSHSKDTLSEYEKLQKAGEKEERENLLFWNQPICTVKYFLLELKEQSAKIPEFMGQHVVPAIVVFFLAIVLVLICTIPGPHQPLVKKLQKTVSWCVYWFGLGVLSSIGLGTGLHTFLLYLGPHIASVTLAAYECGAVNFPEPPYPDEIMCPTYVDPVWTTSMWTIMCKVWLEAVMWGAGTAAGELPPYFMARTARLSGFDPDDEDELKEFQEFQRKKEEHPELLTYVDRMKMMVENLVAKVGFFGILACASIPNPLFDLAGITCGHFLVPFWTFFGATLIGKAVIKMMIQQTFVIVAFNEALIAKAVNRLSSIPLVGHRLQKPVTEFFKQQKERLHRKGSDPVDKGVNWIGEAFDLFVFCMVLYFVVSIVHSLAQSYHKRLCKLAAQERKSVKSEGNTSINLEKKDRTLLEKEGFKSNSSLKLVLEKKD